MAPIEDVENIELSSKKEFKKDKFKFSKIKFDTQNFKRKRKNKRN